MLLEVCELGVFQRQVAACLTDEERHALILELAADPTAGDVIPGTGGIRKHRFRAEGRGKRGGVRVIYYYYSHTIPLFLLAVYKKGAKVDLTAKEASVLKKIVELILSEYKVK